MKNKILALLAILTITFTSCKEENPCENKQCNQGQCIDGSCLCEPYIIGTDCNTWYSSQFSGSYTGIESLSIAATGETETGTNTINVLPINKQQLNIIDFGTATFTSQNGNFNIPATQSQILFDGQLVNVTFTGIGTISASTLSIIGTINIAGVLFNYNYVGTK